MKTRLSSPDAVQHGACAALLVAALNGATWSGLRCNHCWDHGPLPISHHTERLYGLQG